MKKLIFTLIFFISFLIPSHSNQSVEEIIKGRKAMFSENYQNAKKISILLKSKRIEEAKPLMEKISGNYKELLNYYSTPGQIYNLVKFSKELDIDIKHLDLKSFLSILLSTSYILCLFTTFFTTTKIR